MRMPWVMAGIFAVALGACCAHAQPPMPADQLVREVVYNELNDHVSHGYWRYWVESHTPKESLREEFLETADGPITRIELSNGHPLDVQGRQLEQERLHRLLDSPAERALAVELLRFSAALDMTVADYRPNQLTSYLFDLANRYSTFFEQCHVLRAPNETLRQSRLLLCDLTARTIQKGLELLGIEVVEKM